MRNFITLFISLFLLGGVSLAADEPRDERSNIIVVMADDMGFSDLVCHGSEIKTPGIDQLAKEGVRSSQSYKCALCGLSRASLMTGCFPWSVEQKRATSKFANLTRHCATELELPKANGYAPCTVGRLDMITGEDCNAPVRIAGCTDQFLDTPSGGLGNYYRAAKGTPWFKGGKRFDRPVGEYSTDLISAFGTDFIEDSAESDKPFFIHVSHYAQHWSLHAEEGDIAPYRALHEKRDRAGLIRARLSRLVDSGLIPKWTTMHIPMLNVTGKGSIPLRNTAWRITRNPFLGISASA